MSGNLYVNAGDKVDVIYKFDVHAGMRGGDRISLSNGEYATYVSQDAQHNVTFSYVVTNTTPNTLSLTQSTTTIVPGDRTTDQTGFTYAVTSSAPQSPIIVDTVAPTKPVISAIGPDTDPVGDHTTAQTSITLSGTADANSTVILFRNGVEIATTQADANGDWSVADPGTLADQTSYTFTATSKDFSGNQSGASDPYAVNIDTAICFCAGTAIRAQHGETPVEDLRIGDLVMAAPSLSQMSQGPSLQPVRWIGRQTVSIRFADPAYAYPVRIMAGALGEGLPVRDLCVSPEHALFLDGVLVQAGALVNGHSIRRLTGAELPDVFTYFHIELEQHGLVQAEGALAETFVDNVTRRRFDNWAEYEALYGAECGVIGELEAPRIKSARQLPPAMRARLDARAEALGLTADKAAA